MKGMNRLYSYNSTNNYYSSPPMNYCNNVYNPYTAAQYLFGNRTYNPFYNSNIFTNHYTNPSNPTDYGPSPFVVNIEDATKQNNLFRISLWTGNYLQLTLMSINVGEDIGLEVHPNLDQFIRIEEGQGIVRMGDSRDSVDFQAYVHDDFVILIPAGKWHNIINTGNRPLKLYSIYAPPQHPHGTVHITKQDAERNH
jgi:mannose-6-phosphate isomerase-like protein (cupin superfamily)